MCECVCVCLLVSEGSAERGENSVFFFFLSRVCLFFVCFDDSAARAQVRVRTPVRAHV